MASHGEANPAGSITNDALIWNLNLKRSTFVLYIHVLCMVVESLTFSKTICSSRMQCKTIANVLHS
jgi:hypothetical protein